MFDKNGRKIAKTISYKIQLIDSSRFMASSFSNLADNLPEGIRKTISKWKWTQ